MKIRIPFLIAFTIILLLASSAGLLPHSVLPGTPEAARPYIPPQSDKFLHFVTFFALSATFYFILDTARRRTLHITLIVCTGVLAVGSEVAQGLLPNDREFDAWDVLANVLGSLAAAGLCTTYHKRQLERRRRAKYSALTGDGLAEEEMELDESGTGIPQHRVNPEDVEALAADGQETGILRQLSATVPAETKTKTKQTVEEEVDNWDENAEDEWDDDDDIGVAGGNTAAKMMTPSTSDDGDLQPKKLAVD